MIKIERIEGYVRIRFCYAPGGRSPLEIIKNYEEAVSEKGGDVLHLCQKCKESKDAYLKKGHFGRRMDKWEYIQFPHNIHYYFSGKIPTDTVYYYVCVVAVNIEGTVVYSLYMF